MSSTQTSASEHGQLSLTGTPKDMYQSFKMGMAGARVLGAIFWFMLGLVQLFALIFSSWATCFTRERVGLIPLLFQSGLGVPLLALLTLTFEFAWARYTMLAWLFAVLIAHSVHLIQAVRRFVKPAREHVHTRSMGRPNAPVRKIWEYLSDSDKVEPLHVALLLEPALWGIAAYGVGMLEWTLFRYGGVPISGVSLLLLLAALGIFTQAAAIWLRDRWTLMKLLDDLESQTRVESAVAEHPSIGAGRETEGVATIDDGLFAGAQS